MTGAVVGLHHVQVSCPAGSEDDLRGFYAGVLGMAELAKPPVLAARGGVWFRAGACEVHCGVEAGFVPARKAHPGILVEGLDALAERLADAGTEVTWDDDFPGMRRLYATDPVGNRLELLEPRLTGPARSVVSMPPSETQTAQFGSETSTTGAFVRQGNRFTDRISRDSTSAAGAGPDDQGRWPVEAGRYRLVVSLACPWAHRSVIVRRLLGLTGAISLAVVDPIRDERGWRFWSGDGHRDPVLDVEYLSEPYLATDPSYEGRVTVPAVVDTMTGRVVTNDYPQITLDLSTQWGEHHAPGAPDLYPGRLREPMQPLIDEIFRDVNNGVYRCGFATEQAAYEEAFAGLFARLDALSERLEGQRFLMGDAITEVDVRLFTTLVRFDAAYHGHFKTNRNKLTEMPVLWAYARDLFQTPGFGDTVDFDHIKRHYYGTHEQINPTRIVSVGPDTAGWTSPHGRG